jgi:hypothetical protein
MEMACVGCGVVVGGVEGSRDARAAATSRIKCMRTHSAGRISEGPTPSLAQAVAVGCEVEFDHLRGDGR